MTTWANPRAIDAAAAWVRRINRGGPLFQVEAPEEIPPHSIGPEREPTDDSPLFPDTPDTEPPTIEPPEEAPKKIPPRFRRLPHQSLPWYSNEYGPMHLFHLFPLPSKVIDRVLGLDNTIWERYNENVDRIREIDRSMRRMLPPAEERSAGVQNSVNEMGRLLKHIIKNIMSPIVQQHSEYAGAGRYTPLQRLDLEATLELKERFVGIADFQLRDLADQIRRERR